MAQSPLKIVYVGNFATNSVGEPEIAWALEKLGHQVIRFEESNRTKLPTLDDLRVLLHKEKPNLLLFAKFKMGSNLEIREFLAKDMKPLRIPTVCWLFDLYWGYRREKEIRMDMLGAFSADVVFTTDGGHQEKFAKYGINHFCLRQGIDERVQKAQKVEGFKPEIAFIGSRHTWSGWPYRGQLIDFLGAAYGDRFAHLGANGEIRHEELDRVMASLKVVVCDTVNSDYYWSNRIYETIGRGGFAVHPRVVGLDWEFKEYEHFVPYRFGDFKGLKDKIDYFLAHDAEREAIRDAGYEYCHEHHTYTKRVGEFLRTLEQQRII